ncbi:glycosyltransferase family 2 protein [uncultured Helicobacter sp.]|uniref:glycosyltransferase family 2 protein n=7 Tax=uncultured Helicobacter sp. TaxID=175537 RepID=UPI0025D72E53|nr:glycosyltransferase family 2 protein [uncultured Helicobacter sp.]
MSPRISLIIPTYNAKDYIAICLESCINQSFRDIEILIIDDCGNDGAIDIAKSYAKRDSRIRIIRNSQNLGTFAARIEGIKHAKGAYICFIDADDYIESKMCEVLEQTLLAHKEPDIIHFNIHYKGNKKTSLLANAAHKLRYILPIGLYLKPLSNTNIAYNFFLKNYHFPKFTLWDKCFKSTLLKQTLPLIQTYIPLKLIMAEDMLHFFIISLLAKSYVGINARLYVYCLNHISITQNKAKVEKKILDMRHIIQALHTLAKELVAHNPLAPKIAKIMGNNLGSLMILESRFYTPQHYGMNNKINRGGGKANIAPRYNTYSSITPCRAKPYCSLKASAILHRHLFALYALLHTILAVLESLPYLYPSKCIYPKLYTYQALSTPTPHFILLRQSNAA